VPKRNLEGANHGRGIGAGREAVGRSFIARIKPARWTTTAVILSRSLVVADSGLGPVRPMKIRRTWER
jgi:hypothetical protein